jgi:hypothetical protein
VLNYVFYACFVMLECYHVFHRVYELQLVPLILYDNSISLFIVIKCFKFIKMNIYYISVNSAW